MSKKQLRSTSTNARLKAPRYLDESTSLSQVQQSLILSSSKSTDKPPENPKKLKLPHISLESSKRLSNDLSSTPDIPEETIHSLKANLQAEWATRGVPKALQQTYMAKVLALPRHKAVTVISREIEDLKKNRSPMMNALRAVIAREESLQSIFEMNNYLTEVAGWEKMKDVQLECAELLHAHRLLTINAVESIVKWRELISFSAVVNNQSEAMHIPFIYNDSNYLAKMRNDLDFLKNSEFSKVFQFDTLDPLLVKPSKPTFKAKDKKIDTNYFIQHGQVVVSLPSSLKPKSDYAEEIIGREFKAEMQLTPAQTDEVCAVIYEELCEEEVRNEVQNFLDSTKPEVANGVANKLLEEVIGNMCESIAKDWKNEKNKESNLKIAPEVMEKMVNSEVDRMLNEIVKEELVNLNKEKKENSIREQRIKEENANLARMIYNDLFGDVIGIMAEQTIDEIAAQNKENEKKIQKARDEKEKHSIAERIRNDYIEIIINELTAELSSEMEKLQFNRNLLDSIYSDLLKQLIQETVFEHIAELIRTDYIEIIIKELTVQASTEFLTTSYDSKIADALYQELLAQLIKETISSQHSELLSQRENKKQAFLNDLAERIYNDLFSSIIPDIQEVANSEFENDHHLYFDKEEMVENMGLEFVREESTFSEISSLRFKTIPAPASVFPKIIEEYYPKIPQPELNVTADQEKLDREIQKVEAHWYWGLISKTIVGLLVFSVDFDRDDVRVINIHHLSCLDWRFYRDFIEAACKFIWDSDHCQEIRLNLYVEGPTEIPLDVKKVLNSLRFRWRTNIVDEEEEDCAIIVMGQPRPQIKMKEVNNVKKNLLGKIK
jgi:hypothetical protein